MEAPDGFLAREPDDERVVFLGAGPLARFSESSWEARSAVICSTDSERGMVTLVSPSVMYSPKRPSLMIMGLSVIGSVPRSFSGGLAAPRPRCFGRA